MSLYRIKNKRGETIKEGTSVKYQSKDYSLEELDTIRKNSCKLPFDARVIDVLASFCNSSKSHIRRLTKQGGIKIVKGMSRLFEEEDDFYTMLEEDDLLLPAKAVEDWITQVGKFKSFIIIEIIYIAYSS